MYEIRVYGFKNGYFKKVITIFIALFNLVLVYFICWMLLLITMDYCSTLLSGERLH